MHTLLVAVQHHLWLGRAVMALRRALWASAALWLVVMAVRLAGLPLTAGAALLAQAALCAAALGWAVLQRPTPAACAWWADRNLGGAMAYTTLLEATRGAPIHPLQAAAQQLQHWAVRQAPVSLQQLSNVKKTQPMWWLCARPLVAMLLCISLAGAVFALHQPQPGNAGSALQAGAGAAALPAAPADASTALARAPEAAPMVDALSKALRAQPSDLASDGANIRKGSAAGTTPVDGADAGAARDEPASASPADAPTPPAAAVPNLARAPNGAAPVGPDTPSPSAGTTLNTAAAGDAAAAGRDTGRDAGTSADLRAPGGRSSVQPVPLVVQHWALPNRAGQPGTQADAGRAAAYSADRDTAARATMRDAAATAQPAPATPPTATHTLQLSATENHYVQAWMKARAQHP